MRQMVNVVLVCAAVLGVALETNAAVKVARVFSNNMVLQQQMPIRVWGWADPREVVTVAFNDSSAKATAGDDGYWRVDLPAMKADGKAHTLTVKASNTVEHTGIVLGEVWIAAGQSNMNREVKVEADHPDIRLFWIHGHVTPIERGLGDNAIGWEPATRKALEAITPERKKWGKVYGAGTAEVGWVFGKRVHEQTKVPVGIIKTAFGGSQALAWTPIDNFTEKYTYGKKEEGGYIGHRPGLLYNTMLQGLGPMSVRGVVWYQGENDGRNYNYDRDLAAMIKSWRGLFEQPDLPFYLAQIGQTTYASGMERVWECQSKVAASDPHVHYGVSVNLFDSLEKGKGYAVREHKGNERDPGTGWPISGGSNPHPPNKHVVANRLADLAIVNTYGVDLEREVHAPRYVSHETKGNKLIVKFIHVGEGLKTDDGEAPNWFEVSDGSQDEGRAGERFRLIYKKATAKIVGKDTIEVTSPDVAKPTHVRLAWHALARHNLTNSDGVPAENFRTDTQKTKQR